MKPKQRLFRLRIPAGQQVDEEIALHIELRTRELMARGMAADVARAEAERRFGQFERARLLLRHAAVRRERRMTVREWLAGWAQDFGYSARALSREWTLALVVVMTLALGLGATTVMFGVVDHLLLSGPAHVVDPDNVRRFFVTERSMFGGTVQTSSGTGYVTYAVLRDNTTSLDGVAAYYDRPTARVGRGETAREMPVGWSTHDLFAVLGVVPHAGRFYTADEDRPNDPTRVAVIDYAFWKSDYTGSLDALGRTITVNDDDYTIIGVTPRGFTGPDRRPASIWLPLSAGFKPHPEWLTTWNAHWVQVVARLRAGVTAEAAAADATRAYRAAAEGHRQAAAEGSVALLPLHYGPGGEIPPETAVARWLLGVSIIVLLIAMANVMNLLLARVLRRRREVAVRLALGISRGRLARLLLTESLLLALVGLAGALAVAHWGGQALRLMLLPDVQWGDPLGGRMLLFAGAAALLTGLLIGLAPVLHAGRQELTSGLRSGAGDGGGRSYMRGALTVAQAALSVVLLVGAGLFVRSLWNVSRVDLGIDADRLLAVWPNFAAPDEAAGDEVQAAERSRRDAFFREAIVALRAQPDIEGAVLAMGTPLQGGLGVNVRVPGRDSIPSLPGGGPWIIVGSPGYFETAGTRILRGRGFEEGEGAGTEAVVVVNEIMANTLWPGEDALTKCLIIGEGRSDDGVDNVPCARVIGVAQNALRSVVTRRADMQYYVPFGQERDVGGTMILVRPRGDAMASIPALRSRLHPLHAGITFLVINPLQLPIERQVRPWRLGATMFLVFGTLALLIAAIGLYSVMAYGVAQRRAEIGVRKALGARAHTIVGMIVRQGVGLVVIGIVLGGIVALAAAPRLEPLLFETAARDPAVIAAVGLVLAAVALLATVIPAARAGQTDVMDVMRRT